MSGGFRFALHAIRYVVVSTRRGVDSIRECQSKSELERKEAMEISLNGEHAFLVKTLSGTVICDPADEDEATFIPTSAADDTVVTALLKSEPAKSTFRRKIAGTDAISHAGEYEIGDLGLRGISLATGSGAQSKNTVTSFRIDAEDLAVYMLGLADAPPDSRTVQLIGGVDVLLLDVARLEMDVKEISSLISALDPSLVLVNGLQSGADQPGPKLKSLLGETGGDQMSTEPQPRVSVSKSGLPADRQLVVLRPRA